MYRTSFPRDLFAELDRFQRGLQQAFELSPNIRGRGRGYPSVNVGSTAASLEVYAFVPGVDPSSLEVQVERNVLTVAGQRAPVQAPEKATLHIGERFEGPFRRVVNLPEDIDAERVSASYRDGVLHVSVPRRSAPQARRINIQ